MALAEIMSGNVMKAVKLLKVAVEGCKDDTSN